MKHTNILIRLVLLGIVAFAAGAAVGYERGANDAKAVVVAELSK